MEPRSFLFLLFGSKKLWLVCQERIVRSLARTHSAAAFECARICRARSRSQSRRESSGGEVARLGWGKAARKGNKFHQQQQLRELSVLPGLGKKLSSPRSVRPSEPTGRPTCP